jgi:hypothetical protein
VSRIRLLPYSNVAAKEQNFVHCVMSSNITKELSQGTRADAVTQPCGEFVWLDEGDI